VWVHHLFKRIYFIGVKTKYNIPWIIRKVLHMAKVELFPLPTIGRMSDLPIPLSLDIPKQELSFLTIREHMVQTVNDR
jgi:hypothetical protein